MLGGLRERIKVESGVHQKDGKWFLRLDGRSEGAEIQPTIAKIVKASLWAENNKKSNKLVQDYFQNINCHQVALFSAGILRGEGMSRSNNYEISLFKTKEFKKFGHVAELTKYLREKLGDKFGLVQIAEKKYLLPSEAPFPIEVLHSFLAGFDSLGRVVCYEKCGTSEPFRVVALEKIFRETWHQPPSDHAWAAIPIEDIEGTEGALHAKSEIEQITAAQASREESTLRTSS